MTHRTLAAFALLAACSCAHAGCTARDSWRGPDKQQHLALGAGIAWIGALQTRDPWQGAAWGVAAGAAKEALDAAGTGTCSLQDFAVTAIGAGIGAFAGGVAIRYLPSQRGVWVQYAANF